MATMKMLLTLLVAAILFCSHQQVVTAREVAVADDENELQLWPWEIPCYLPWPFPWPRPWPCPSPPPPPPPPCSPPPPPPSPPPPAPRSSCSTSDIAQIDKCMVAQKIDPCCPTFKSILGTNCPCYKYAEDKYDFELMSVESYCDFNSPCKGLQVIKLSKEEE